MKKVSWIVVAAGAAAGVAAVLLTALGNPANMGFCVACFLRDIAGALGMHGAEKVQYVRPEITGLIIGALIMALIKGEFRPKAGSSPVTRFFLGVVVMIGALAFLGCPLRMVIRLGGGDMNAATGLLGFALGTGVGVLFLNRGFSLKRSYDMGKTEGVALPAAFVLLLALFLLAPQLFRLSEAGPGSMAAPVLVSLAVAIIVGALAQRSRLCLVGGIRDLFLFRDMKLLYGFVAVFLAVLVGNLITGGFKPGFAGQPIAHSSHLWNLLGMVLVGWGSVLLGGCPLRQLILTGEGNADSAVTVLGLLVGAAISHNFGLAASADSVVDGVVKAGGLSAAGKLAVVAGIVVLGAISLFNLPERIKAAASQEVQ